MEELKSLLNEVFPDIDFETEKNLVDSGLLDSLAIVTLISKLEEHYGIEVTMEYIQPDYFQSMETISEMIEELQ